MDEIIKLKCPLDGIVLTIKYEPGIEHRIFTCPICKRKYPFSQFRMDAQHTDNSGPGRMNPHGGRPAGHPCQDSQDEATNYVSINFTLGMVTLLGTDLSYLLMPGRNVIGRQSASSLADFQIETPGKRGMSREHIVIEVKKEPGKGFVHYLSLCKEKVNATYLGNKLLAYGSSVVLNHDDVIRLPDATLKFEIPDDESTLI